jgi:hypothetical protein
LTRGFVKKFLRRDGMASMIVKTLDSLCFVSPHHCDSARSCRGFSPRALQEHVRQGQNQEGTEQRCPPGESGRSANAVLRLFSFRWHVGPAADRDIMMFAEGLG